MRATFRGRKRVSGRVLLRFSVDERERSTWTISHSKGELETDAGARDRVTKDFDKGVKCFDEFEILTWTVSQRAKCVRDRPIGCQPASARASRAGVGERRHGAARATHYQRAHALHSRGYVHAVILLLERCRALLDAVMVLSASAPTGPGGASSPRLPGFKTHGTRSGAALQLEPEPCGTTPPHKQAIP